MTPGDEEGDDPGELLGRLWQLIQAVLDDADPALAALGLSAKAFFLLDTVGDHPFPADLARRMHLPPPTVTYLVKQLEAKGLLERRGEPGDLRKFRLGRTEAGRDALHRGQEALGLAMGNRLGRLDRGEVEAFARMVGRLAGSGEAPES